MGKQKTRKSAKKRFKINKRGQVVHLRSGRVFTGKRAQKIKKMLGR